MKWGWFCTLGCASNTCAISLHCVEINPVNRYKLHATRVECKRCSWQKAWPSCNIHVKLNTDWQHRRSTCTEQNWEIPVCNQQEQLAWRKPFQSSASPLLHHLEKSVIIFQNSIAKIGTIAFNTQLRKMNIHRKLLKVIFCKQTKCIGLQIQLPENAKYLSFFAYNWCEQSWNLGVLYNSTTVIIRLFSVSFDYFY